MNNNRDGKRPGEKSNESGQHLTVKDQPMKCEKASLQSDNKGWKKYTTRVAEAGHWRGAPEMKKTQKNHPQKKKEGINRH